jgi:hypothetical protein
MNFDTVWLSNRGSGGTTRFTARVRRLTSYPLAG